jgi:hypothetical protein
MNDLVEEYLNYLHEGSASSGAGFLIVGGILYSLFKQWQKKKDVEKGFCSKFKGDRLRLDLCVYEKQLENTKEILSKLKTHGHTCDQSRRPVRCREKVRYFIEKYEDRAVEIEKKIQKVKFKIAKREYKERIKNIKKQQFHSRMRLGD